jgi:AraC family transcriptional regulator, transcriptional activator of pobA
MGWWIVLFQAIPEFDNSCQHQDNSCIIQEHFVTTRVIPSYALYGDQAQPSWQNAFDFEWIPQRSRPYNWEIRPHKHDAFIQILYLTQGGGEVFLDNAKQVMTAPCLVLIPAQTVHGFSFSPNVDGPVVTAAQRPLESLAGVVMPELLRTLRQPIVVALDQTQGHAEVLVPLFQAIQREAHGHEVGQVAMGLSLLTALCVQIARLGNLSKPTALKVNSRKSLQIEKFRARVDQDYKKHRPIAAYADELSITPGQLSRLCREVLGMSSLDVINARLVHEAQRELIYTTASIKQLAHTLGFTDETYFGRFFRKHTGLSPREFRAKALKEML